MRRWYVVQTQPGQEKLASKMVEKLGVEIFYPTFKRTVMHGRRKEQVVRPLFPTYFFASFERDGDWGPILRCHGVFTVLGINKRPGKPKDFLARPIEGERLSETKPIAVPIGVVEALRAVAMANGGHFEIEKPIPKLPRLKPGTKVRVTDGLLQGLSGLVDRDHKERVRVLLDILGGKTPIVLPRESLSASE